MYKMVKKLLEVRKAIKRRKPTYKRQQSNQYAKFKNDDAWRRPKGHQSKIRLGRKGHQGMPEVGFKSPKAVRGLNSAGLKEVIVKNVSDLAKIDSKTQVAVIAGTVGARKKIDILNQAKKDKINFANVKDIDVKIKELSKEKKVKKAPKTEAKTEAKADAKAEVKAEKTEAKKEDVEK